MKKILISFGILFILAVAIILGLNAFFKNKITKFLHSALSENVALSHGEITVNSLQGTIMIEDVLVKLRKSGATDFNTAIQSDHIHLKNLSYWDYFVHGEVHVSKLEIGKNSIAHKKSKGDSGYNKPSSPARLNKVILIDELEIKQSAVKISNADNDSIVLNLNNAKLRLKDIETGPDIISKKIPFTYSGISLAADSLFLSLNPYDDLKVEAISLEDNALRLENTSIKTHYSRAELSKVIKKERDHMDLKIPQITIEGIDWGFVRDSLYTKAATVALTSPSLDIYRDKLVADDNTVKPLYSKALRDLSVGLMVDSLNIDNATIVYSERVKAQREAGQIKFSNLKVKAARVGNTYKKGTAKTTLAITGHFLDHAPLDVTWSFDINDTDDRFRFLATLGAMDAERINQFTLPNLGAKMDGRINKVYFDIDGNNDRSDISMKMSYMDFSVEVLNKKSERNWFISGVANLFVSKDSKNEKANSKNGDGSARRDKTKSFFNYLWLNVKSGLVKTMVGRG